MNKEIEHVVYGNCEESLNDLKSIEELDARVNVACEPLECLHCGERGLGVQHESSRTQYDTADNPHANDPFPLCRACAEEHHANWDAQWEEYYSGRM